MEKYESFNPGIPVIVYDGETELPKQGCYYIVAGNGCFFHKETAGGVIEGLVPVKNIPLLKDFDVDFSVQCKLPKIPAPLVYKIKKFFEKVVDKYTAEANVILYFNSETNDYKIHVPEQIVSRSSVRYRKEALSHTENMGEYLCVGTIHSHANFDAFHSNTDESDEAFFDGLHCTFGNNDKSRFSIASSVVRNGLRRRVEPSDFLEGIVKLQNESICYESICYEFVEDTEFLSDSDLNLEVWLDQVRHLEIDYIEDPLLFRVGDKARWSGGLSQVQWGTICGKGPFDIVSVNGNLVTVQTNVGLISLSPEFFEKVENE